MGGRYSSLVPKYFKNFNIENRALNRVDKIEHANRINEIGVAPRHPTTAHIFKQREESAPNFDEIKLNQRVVESSKQIKVNTAGDDQLAMNKDLKDKRPKKENESMSVQRDYDIDMDKYGYVKPEKIKHGNLTLRQFDELLYDYLENKQTPKIVDNLSQKYNVDSANMLTLLEYYKPFYRMDRPNKSVAANKGTQEPIKESAESPNIESVFPNVKKVAKPEIKA